MVGWIHPLYANNRVAEIRLPDEMHAHQKQYNDTNLLNLAP